MSPAANLRLTSLFSSSTATKILAKSPYLNTMLLDDLVVSLNLLENDEKVIDEASNEIKLLTLHQGNFESPILITHTHTPFASEHVPVFDALSYAWGSPESPIDISVRDPGEECNASLSVTRNIRLNSPSTWPLEFITNEMGVLAAAQTTSMIWTTRFIRHSTCEVLGGSDLVVHGFCFFQSNIPQSHWADPEQKSNAGNTKTSDCLASLSSEVSKAETSVQTAHTPLPFHNFLHYTMLWLGTAFRGRVLRSNELLRHKRECFK